MPFASLCLEHTLAKCGAKLRFFLDSTKYFLYFCTKLGAFLAIFTYFIQNQAPKLLISKGKYKNRHKIMKKMTSRKMGKKLQSSLQALPSMGVAFIVLGVLILAASFAISLKSNILLFAGLFFILAGGAGYIYSIKKG